MSVSSRGCRPLRLHWGVRETREGTEGKYKIRSFLDYLSPLLTLSRLFVFFCRSNFKLPRSPLRPPDPSAPSPQDGCRGISWWGLLSGRTATGGGSWDIHALPYCPTGSACWSPRSFPSVGAWFGAAMTHEGGSERDRGRMHAERDSPWQKVRQRTNKHVGHALGH